VRYLKRRAIAVLALSNLFFFISPVISNANSSWHWVTSSPVNVLPFAIIFTLAIETAAVVLIGRIPDLKKSLIVISLANLFSFLAPALFRAIRFYPVSGSLSLGAAFNKGPYYIVLTGYLVLTLIVELPIVYWLLRKDTRKKLNLIIAILVSNIITTLLVAVCERLICVGSW